MCIFPCVISSNPRCPPGTFLPRVCFSTPTSISRPHTSYLLPPLLEHVASQLSERYAALNAAELPAESTAQYFLDLVWLDGVISAAGEPGGPHAGTQDHRGLGMQVIQTGARRKHQ